MDSIAEETTWCKGNRPLLFLVCRWGCITKSVVIECRQWQAQSGWTLSIYEDLESL